MNDEIPIERKIEPKATLTKQPKTNEGAEPKAQPVNQKQPEISSSQQQGLEKPKRKRGRPPSFKPTQFDWDLIHLLREGTNSVDLILEQLGIAKSELFARIELLKNENLVKEENGEVKLTVNGYNFYSTKGVKKVSLKKAFSGEVKLQKHKSSKQKELPIEGPAQKHVNDFMLSSTEVVDLGGKLGKMDLQEIMARYGPSSEQRDKFLKRKAMEAVQAKQELMPQPKHSSQNQNPTINQSYNQPQPAAFQQGDEQCELCKSNFTLSMSNHALAKYGHCFCGAAYHKDCYDSLLTDTSYCIRCGKKLLLIIDKQGREALKGLRDVFE